MPNCNTLHCMEKGSIFTVTLNTDIWKQSAVNLKAYDVSYSFRMDFLVKHVHGKLYWFFLFSKRTKFFTLSKMFNHGHKDRCSIS